MEERGWVEVNDLFVNKLTSSLLWNVSIFQGFENVNYTCKIDLHQNILQSFFVNFVIETIEESHFYLKYPDCYIELVLRSYRSSGRNVPECHRMRVYSRTVVARMLILVSFLLLECNKQVYQEDDL